MSELSGKGLWALIIGGSSGIGLATAQKLAEHGMNILIIHKDRRSTLLEADKSFNEIRKLGVELVSFNKDGVNSGSIEELVEEIAALLAEKNGKVKLILHSIAQGNLKSLVPSDLNCLTAPTSQSFKKEAFQKQSKVDIAEFSPTSKSFNKEIFRTPSRTGFLEFSCSTVSTDL